MSFSAMAIDAAAPPFFLFRLKKRKNIIRE
jgi:hypothetical protein